NQAQLNSTHCFEMQLKSRLMFLTEGRPERTRYSALEVKDYVFGLKCLVPEPLWPVRNPG
ncbi:hypothetical protein ACFL0M_14710, partial [Thermodesulfobacteriota bacterium]